MATQSVCSISDCGKPTVNVRGWCSAHYMRWLRHGDPLYVKKPAIQLDPCSVDGCGRRVKALGYCNPHYIRFKRYGDPHSGSTGHGEVRRWLDEVAVPYRGNECLPFPYSTDRHGYGRVNIAGKYVGAHVYVAERVLPPRPSAKHEVCHTCGNGNQACVTGAHFYWGTRRQNVHDAIAHGTFSAPPIGARGKSNKDR